jgi:hypothetical protein
VWDLFLCVDPRYQTPLAFPLAFLAPSLFSHFAFSLSSWPLDIGTLGLNPWILCWFILDTSRLIPKIPFPGWFQVRTDQEELVWDLEVGLQQQPFLWRSLSSNTCTWSGQVHRSPAGLSTPLVSSSSCPGLLTNCQPYWPRMVSGPPQDTWLWTTPRPELPLKPTMSLLHRVGQVWLLRLIDFSDQPMPDPNLYLPSSSHNFERSLWPWLNPDLWFSYWYQKCCQWRTCGMGIRIGSLIWLHLWY